MTLDEFKEAYVWYFELELQETFFDYTIIVEEDFELYPDQVPEYVTAYLAR